MVGPDAAPRGHALRKARTRAAQGLRGGQYGPPARSVADGWPGFSNGQVKKSAARRWKENAAMARREAGDDACPIRLAR